MDKRKVIIHYNSLSKEVLQAIEKKYPDGFENHVFKVVKKNNDFFYAITVDTADASYLVKVDVNVDALMDDFSEPEVIEESGYGHEKTGDIVDETWEHEQSIGNNNDNLEDY